MATIEIEVWCTTVSKSGKNWFVQSDSTLVTLSIEDLNDDGVIDNSEWDAYTDGGGGGLDRGSSDALYDGTTGTNGVLYSSVEYTTGDNVTPVIKSLSNSFNAVPEDVGDVVCFCRGTLIRTDKGEVPVEELEVGDLVDTVDGGVQPIRWIGSCQAPANERLAPIKFQKGAIGNERDLWLSPQHRVLLRDWRAELMFGMPEVLIPAKSLINDTTIQKVEGGVVEYFHILLDAHHLIFAEGIPAESLFLSEWSVGVLGDTNQNEIFDLFPEISELGFDALAPTRRPVLKNFEAKVLTAA